MTEQFSVAPPPPPPGPGYAVEQVRAAEANTAERTGLEEAVQADLSPDQLRKLARVTYVETWGRFDDAYGPEQDEQICDLLCQYQAQQRAAGKPDYDVFKIKPRAVHIVREHLVNQDIDAVEADQTGTVSQREARADSKDTEFANFQALKEGLEQDEAWLAKPKAEQVADILGHPATPESVKATWRQYLKVLEIAAQHEADGAIVAAQFEKVDIWNPPPIESFVSSFIFAEESGVSAATQTAIAAELNIQRPDLDVDTGSQMNDVFKKGVGTKQVRDPDTGEIREEPLFLRPGEFQSVREGQSIGLTDNGQQAMRFETQSGNFVTPLPKNASAEDMVQYGLAGQMMSALHEMNMAEIFYPGRSSFERGGGVL